MSATVKLTTFALLAAALLGVGCHENRRRDSWREREFQARCGKIMDRIDFDRQKADEIEPGRHEKAKQWYLDDIENAQRDLERCRASLDRD